MNMAIFNIGLNSTIPKFGNLFVPFVGIKFQKKIIIYMVAQEKIRINTQNLKWIYYVMILKNIHDITYT